MTGIGSVLADRWELVAPVGGGGMGTVWRARDRERGVDVAVKLMAKHVRGLASFEERFSREAIAVEAVRHPNVVEVLGHGTTDAHEPFLVLELLDGESLGWRIERPPPPLAREAIGWIVDALAGLEAVHAAGIVHRDLKPDNVFLALGPGGRTVVKLLDFGISRMSAPPGAAAWDSLTRSGEMLGTPVYMAPEQGTDARHVDPRADIFSMGAILYQTLAGRAPFEGANIGEILLAVNNDDPEPLDRIVPEVGREVAAIAERALAKHPDGRFATAAAMREALEAALPSVPEDARCGAFPPPQRTVAILGSPLPSDPPPRAPVPVGQRAIPTRLMTGRSAESAALGGRASDSGEGRELPADAGDVFDGELDLDRGYGARIVLVALAILALLAVFGAYVVLGGSP